MTSEIIQTTFFLARHGETEWNCERRLQGRLDSPLTLAGQLQAKSLAEKLRNENIDIIITSPLGRAKQTAMDCQSLLGVELAIDSELQERHFGVWQNRLFDDLSQEMNFHPVFFQVNDTAPPEGESGQHCGDRIKDALAAIANTGNYRNVLIVTHGDAIRCFLAMLEYRSECDAYSQYGNGHIFPVAFCHQTQYFRVLTNE